MTHYLIHLYTLWSYSNSKGKVTPLQARLWPIGGVDVYLYSFTNMALEGGEGSTSRPGRSLPPGKTRYPLYRRLGGPQGRSGQVRKISFPRGFDPRTVLPVAQSLYRLSYRAHPIVIILNHNFLENLIRNLKLLRSQMGRFCRQSKTLKL